MSKVVAEDAPKVHHHFFVVLSGFFDVLPVLSLHDCFRSDSPRFRRGTSCRAADEVDEVHQVQHCFLLFSTLCSTQAYTRSNFQPSLCKARSSSSTQSCHTQAAEAARPKGSSGPRAVDLVLEHLSVAGYGPFRERQVRVWGVDGLQQVAVWCVGEVY